MNTTYNFSAGPSMLPKTVLQKAQEEIINWQGSGVSPMEIGHRTPLFQETLQTTEANLRGLLGVPNNYRILFMHGGAQTQFSMIPMNLLGNKSTADFIVTGIWSQKAMTEAKKYCETHVVTELNTQLPQSIPAQSTWQFSHDAAYVYYTSNETISGVEFDYIPDTGNVPLVCDATSSILSRPLDITSYGLIFAGAQKNLGIAGLGIVIVRDDLLDRAAATTPVVFHYATQVKQSSLYNTPPIYACYMAGLMCDWIKSQGGVEALEAMNIRKAKKLYALIDHGDFYTNAVDPSCRSRMNVTFRLPTEALEATFLEKANAEGLINLKGHRSVGGIRASIYNAMPEAGVDALVTFMEAFEKQYG